MPDPLLDKIIDRLLDQQQLLSVHQDYLLALHAYLREQPTYDDARFQALLEGQRQKKQGLRFRLAESDEVLKALLKDFDGPVQ